MLGNFSYYNPTNLESPVFASSVFEVNSDILGNQGMDKQDRTQTLFSPLSFHL